MLFCLLDPDSRGLLECGTGSGSTKLIISIIFVSAEKELYSRFKQCVQYFGRMPGFESETLWPLSQSLQIFLMIYLTWADRSRQPGRPAPPARSPAHSWPPVWTMGSNIVKVLTVPPALVCPEIVQGGAPGGRTGLTRASEITTSWPYLSQPSIATASRSAAAPPPELPRWK